MLAIELIMGGGILSAATVPQSSKSIARPGISLRQAQKAKRPYWIESVVCLVDIQDSAAERQSTFRFIYTLHLLRDITLEDRTFQESLHNYFGREKIVWSGSVDPVESRTVGPETTFEVTLSGKKGQTRTVVTGMTIVENLPLRPRELRGFHFGERDYAFLYPNSEDFIGQLTVIVGSRTTQLNADGLGAWRKPSKDGTPILGPASVAKAGDAVRAGFENLVPGEVVALRYSWR